MRRLCLIGQSRQQSVQLTVYRSPIAALYKLTRGLGAAWTWVAQERASGEAQRAASHLNETLSAVLYKLWFEVVTHHGHELHGTQNLKELRLHDPGCCECSSGRVECPCRSCMGTPRCSCTVCMLMCARVVGLSGQVDRGLEHEAVHMTCVARDVLCDLYMYMYWKDVESVTSFSCSAGAAVMCMLRHPVSFGALQQPHCCVQVVRVRMCGCLPALRAVLLLSQT